MAFSYSPKIVTDGLVLYLDAANPYSYVSGSTTWNDLSRAGNNGTLTNGPTFNTGSGGSIVFDGVNDYASIAPTVVNTPWSLCTVIRASNSGFPALYSQDGLRIWVGITPSLAVGVHVNFNTRSDTPAGSFTLNQTSFIGVSSTPTVLSVFINSTKYSLTTYSNPTTNTLASIASYSDKTKDFFQGSIFTFSMYNKALSDDEVLQNYNATKGRFGLK